MIVAILSLALAVGAPTPFDRPLPEFQPGMYRGKWGGSEWGWFRFDPDGRFYSRYQTVQSGYWGMGCFFPDGCGETQVYDCHYEGLWSWDSKKRILTIRERSGQYDGNPKTTLNPYLLKFGRSLDQADVGNDGVKVLLKTRERDK